MSMKSVSFPPQFNAINQTVKVITPLTHLSSADQTITGRVTIQGEAQAQTYQSPQHAGGKVEKRVVHVDLNNSEIGAPINMLDQNDMRGYYVEWVEYKIWVQRLGEKANETTPLKGWSIFSESPNTSNSSGSVTSTISWGLNASLGTFGDMPTASVGGNLGISDSHSHSLTDFTFVQRSTSNVLHHKVYLSMCEDGKPYDNSSSLVDSAQNPFVGIQLRPLPALAKSNVPLVGQAVWMNEDDASLFDRLTVYIAVTPHWDLVEGENNGMLQRQTTALGGTFTYSVDVDFSDISDTAAALTITSAEYGVPGKTANVVGALDARKIAGRLSMPVNNDTMGGDPAPNQAKTLSVTYQSQGKSTNVTVKEGGQLTLG